MNNSDLASRAASGDKAALRQMYEQCRRELFLFARSLANGNLADAEDVLQESLLRVWEARRDLAGVRNVRAYLFTTLRNVFLNFARRESREARKRAEHPTAPDFFDTRPPDETIEVNRLNEALASLPEEQRQVVVLKIWGELTFAEIGGVLNVPEKTAASRYRYAIQKLKGLLGGPS
jgi:RNA polymerase sigma-70 factor (ECF subfamily)